MLGNCGLVAAFFLALATALPLALAQEPEFRPPPYRGMNTLMDGVFVTPVPGAAFSAIVKLESTQALPDGTSATRRSIAVIARDSRGRIYNERRQLLPSTFTGTPQVISSHIFDPETRISTFLNHYSHLARQQTVQGPATEGSAQIPAKGAAMGNPFFKQEDLGTDMMESVAVHGIRQTRTIPAAAAGTGKDLVIIDEYWYSEELHMNMLTKRNDPRSGVQVVYITQVSRNEPDPATFEVPPGYKVVDENPPN